MRDTGGEEGATLLFVFLCVFVCLSVVVLFCLFFLIDFPFICFSFVLFLFVCFLICCCSFFVVAFFLWICAYLCCVCVCFVFFRFFFWLLLVGYKCKRGPKERNVTLTKSKWRQKMSRHGWQDYKRTISGMGTPALDITLG